MNATLSDEDLTRLLGEAAEAFDVPEPPAGLGADVPPGPPVWRRRWVQVVAVAAVLVGAVVLASGSPGNRHRPVAAGPISAPALRAPQHVPAQVRSALGGGTAGALAPGVAGSAPNAAPQFRPMAGGPDVAATLREVPAAAGVGGAAVAAPAPDGARIVKTGELSLVVKNGQVTPTLSRVAQAASAVGGYVSSSESQEYGSTPSGSVTLRVPVSKFDGLVSTLRSFNAQVRTATLSGRDVTADYSDLQAQLTTLRAARSRFLDLLAKANGISEILTVQQKVDDVTGQIDRLEGQRRVLASQSDLATLSVTVTQADDPIVTPIAKPRSGLAQAFVDAKDGFVTGIEGLIRRSGRALLVLLCLGAAVLVIRFAWRQVRRGLI